MCKNMQELKQYVANKRKRRGFQHYELNKVHGECQPFTDREYKQVKIRGKNLIVKQVSTQCTKCGVIIHRNIRLKTIKINK